jgi:hypothetical protein
MTSTYTYTYKEQWDPEDPTIPMAQLFNMKEYPEMVKALGPYDPDKDYVGAEGDWKSKHIPRKFFGVDINICAYIHDFYYIEGGTKKDRFHADAAFLVDMMDAIYTNTNTWPRGFRTLQKYLAMKMALRYYMVVRAYGEEAFNLHEKRVTWTH